MPQNNHEPKRAEAGEQVPARPHDSGSAANETIDGLDHHRGSTARRRRYAFRDRPGRCREDAGL
jgi:hypothetical protein